MVGILMPNHQGEPKQQQYDTEDEGDRADLDFHSLRQEPGNPAVSP
jgi:hypothetical protein